jgi:ketosteroid isomerase-like protein
MAKQRNLLADVRALDEFSAFDKKYDEAFKQLDASAMAAFYTEDGVVVTPDGWFSGRENIEKWYAYMFRRWHPTNSIRQNDQLTAVGNQAWAVGRWWSTLRGENGPVLARGASGQRFMFVRAVLGRSAWPTTMLPGISH